MQTVLTINAGSSSIKYALFDADADAGRAPARQALATGQVDGLGVGGAAHATALHRILQQLDTRSVCAVGHRVVHGGTRFEGPARVDAQVLADMAALTPLAPLHQPHNLAGIHAASAALPGVPQVACFDTAFHRFMPAVHQRFALPQAWHDSGVRRYGFHGLSYESIRAQLLAAAPPWAQGRVVVAHLGNGASMCALQAGLPVATTMSFSPLDGLPSGTRCGRIDAAVVLYLMGQRGMSLQAVEDLLARESGWLGLSGLSSDMRTLLASEEAAAKMAVDYLVEHILRELAGLAAALRGVDALVFTGGIGQNAAGLRQRVLEGAAWLGFEAAAQGCQQGQVCITTARSAATAWVLATNEEAVIAAQTLQCI